MIYSGDKARQWRLLAKLTRLVEVLFDFFSQVGLWITLFIIKQKYQKAKQNNTKQNIQKHMKPVLCWSITHGLRSCSGVWFMYLWHTIGAKCFFPFPQVSLVWFLMYILLYILYILFAEGWDFGSMLLFMVLGFYLAWICSCLRQAIKFSMSTYMHLSCCFVKILFSWSY